MAATTPGNLSAQVHETHTGLVMLLGEFAYKTKKAVVTDFLDFSTAQRREAACVHEIELNGRLAPDSYLGLAHFNGIAGAPPEPVIVMRRYPDAHRLTSLVKHGSPVKPHLASIAQTVASFHARAARGESIDACATADAVAARWRDNIDELYRQAVLARETIDEVWRLAAQYISGRSALFAQRIAERRIVDGHADLLADDCFCMPEGPVLLDCLEFDDKLRYVDGLDDVAFLAMDLEFLGRKDLAEYLLAQYRRAAGETAPSTLADFYIAYRAVVRGKVDCVRVAQGHPDAVADAQRHLDIALDHLRAGTVRLVTVGGGPGTGKTTLSRALAEQIGAQVISTDDVRRELQAAGVIAGGAGEAGAGLYCAQNVAAVYDAVLQRARECLRGGTSVILDATWRDARQRARARSLAAEAHAPLVELCCSLPLPDAAARIENRGATTSDATPEIAARLARSVDDWPDAHRIDTGGALTESVADASSIVYAAVS
ncbi:AAA family ATPase [Mycolicibacterium pulveris]|uniref:bifunctional aminoglycoside phosphotransferase/ATP-binding protein n=1 Tax=Mycolicibacterium pulveris TaxID=36813 RepID=UPI003CEEAFE5